jgi:choline monooxygenase
VDEPRHRVDADISVAGTFPAALYHDRALFERVRERVLARSWQLAIDAVAAPRAPGDLVPLTLLAGCLDEPVLLTRDPGGALHCLSNVCTHRGNLLVEEPGQAGGLRCRYHGRRFSLDGRFLSMPEFEAARDFPRDCDDLPHLPTGRLGPCLFTSASSAPAFPFDELVAPLGARVGALLDGPLTLDPAGCREYEVQASWALYCDNYLEGFHVPFVHAGLQQALDYGAYATELFPWCSLQLGVAADGQDAFDALDAGRRIAAYYFFLFPNTAFNFYPWGLSVNVVVPLAVDRTRIVYRTWVSDPSRRDRGAGADLDRVEREDERVIEQVQRGVRSRLYRGGRYSPARESGVHHFHRLLARLLDEP